jgi:hypothetical protein
MTLKYARMDNLIPPLSTNPRIGRIRDRFLDWQRQVISRYPNIMRGARGWTVLPPISRGSWRPTRIGHWSCSRRTWKPATRQEATCRWRSTGFWPNRQGMTRSKQWRKVCRKGDRCERFHRARRSRYRFPVHSNSIRKQINKNSCEFSQNSLDKFTINVKIKLLLKPISVPNGYSKLGGTGITTP